MKAKKVILLGIDGQDPQVTQRLFKENLLPNFSRIAQQGIFSPLRTINPTQSPVIWSSIATGKNPGHHGVFDFIRRRPLNYLPELAIVRFNEMNFLAQKNRMFLPARKGTAFWQTTSKADIPTTVIRWPLTLPAEIVKGNMLAGLGVPDLKGTLGRYLLFTSDQSLQTKEKGDITIVDTGPSVNTKIMGPGKSFVPLKINFNPACIEISTADTKITVREKEWSPWFRMQFKVSPFKKVSGISRFYLESIKPHFNLYMLPIQADPSDSPFDITSPPQYAGEIAKQIGLYATLGMPEDTNALNENVLSPEAFLELCDKISEEREKMFFYELQRFNEGLFAFVFDTLDRIQHVFYRINKKNMKEEYSQVLSRYYQKMDRTLGKILDNTGDDTVIIIVSDHGFTYYDKSFHLNRWLIHNGLLVLKPGAEEGLPLFRNVIWEKTQAYALGFSSIYLNLEGRESRGIVKEHKAHNLKKKISVTLEQFKDPSTNQTIIENVYLNEELFDGPFSGEAPDLVVGFKPGYRMSWQTAVGASPLAIMEENDKYWASDHIVDAKFVPGVFFINRKIDLPASLSVLDVAPLILKTFGIEE